MDKLSELRLPEVIVPKFSLNTANVSDQVIVSIREGSVRYHEREAVLTGINFSLSSKDRIGIAGDNGSGKSTLVRAVMSYSTTD